MKKDLIKVGVISGLVGSIICGGVGSVVAYNIAANQIEYTPQSAGWKVNSVSEAIDSLYISKAGENYTEGEKVVGTWIDGKPLYQKTINCGQLPNQTTKTINAEISADTIVYLNGMITSATKAYPIIYTSSLTRWLMEIEYNYTTNSISITSSDNWSNYIGYITLQYTKSTDTAPGQS